MNNILKYNETLYRVDLKQNYCGYEKFISSLVVKSDKTFIVDVGPSSSIKLLVDSLKELEINKLDAILLTHIHIDHAGGIGDLLSHFPGTPVVLHSSGFDHLSNPSILYDQSIKTLGIDKIEAYGKISKLQRHNMVVAEDFCEYGITPIMTPGHAPHHVSYLYEDIMFVGEAAGTFIDEGDSGLYIRPATPPPFFIEPAVLSLLKLTAFEHKRVFAAHMGSSERPRTIYNNARNQLFLWEELISENQPDSGSDDSITELAQLIIKRDPNLVMISSMGADDFQREMASIKNSISGFMGYLFKTVNSW